jgi:hypothetical protein
MKKVFNQQKMPFGIGESMSIIIFPDSNLAIWDIWGGY